MTEDPDKLRALRRALGHRDDSVQPGADSPLADEIYVGLLHKLQRPQSRRRRSLLVVVASIAVLALAGSAYALLRSPSNPLDVTCFAAPNLDANRFGAQPKTEDLMGVCVEAWRQGELANPAVPPGQVPSLIACTGKSDTLWVFPSLADETCQSLGLSSASGHVEDDSPLLLSERLTTYIQSQDCIPLAEAEREVATILDDLGLDQWSLAVDSPLPGRPCASIAFDASNKQVTLVPARDTNPSGNE